MAAAIFNGLFGGAKPSASPIPAGDSGARYDVLISLTILF